MEDDKKKYEDALERCKKEFNFSNLAYSHEEIKQRLEHVFPELKESEDEKIRKNCIHFLELQKNHHAATFEIDECIAWLEKQREQKETLCDKRRKEHPFHSCQDITELGRCAVEHEQKPAWWSEEETYIEDIISCLEYLEREDTERQYNGDRCVNPMRYKPMIDWLKSIPQPKQEWSEENEQMINDIIEAIDKTYAVSDYQEMVTWLKSIKYRYTWKPSDEQMDALEKECIAHSNYELCRLLEQLKKLKRRIKL